MGDVVDSGFVADYEMRMLVKGLVCCCIVYIRVWMHWVGAKTWWHGSTFPLLYLVAFFDLFVFFFFFRNLTIICITELVYKEKQTIHNHDVHLLHARLDYTQSL